MSLPDLYTAQVGSPYTTLAAPYTTGATTMAVADATKLPNAPNIVCLSGSLAGEFRYTGKDGNSLTGVYALPGTPAATWPAGMYAFRGVAAYDLNALKQRTEAAQTQIDFLAAQASPIIGIEWDHASSNPQLIWIDAAGSEIESLPVGFFDGHASFGGRRRCVRDRATGLITYGANPRGDGLALDGSMGDVLTHKPAFYARAEYDADTDLSRWWLSPRPAAGFVLHPNWMQRGGYARPSMMGGSFEACGYLNAAGQFCLGSVAGKQPVTGGAGYPDLPNGGRFTIDDAETYAGNVAPGMGITNFWHLTADQLLMYIEYKTFDIQSALGAGIVDLPSGEGFAGKLTGADDINIRLGENGTGVGSGPDSQTPVTYRCDENPHMGNVYEFGIGFNAMNSDGSYRLTKRDGMGVLAGSLPAGSYESMLGAPIVDGYISDLQHGDLAGLAFLPEAATGSSSTYLCDMWYYPRYNPSILRAGGHWYHGRSAGPSCRHTSYGVTSSARTIGARLEFFSQGA